MADSLGFRMLQQWVYTVGRAPIGAVDRVAMSCDLASGRGLVAAHGAGAGDVLLSLPWRLALTADSALKRLQTEERLGRGLLPNGVAHLLALINQQGLQPKALTVTSTPSSSTPASSTSTPDDHHPPEQAAGTPPEPFHPEKEGLCTPSSEQQPQLGTEAAVRLRSGEGAQRSAVEVSQSQPSPAGKLELLVPRAMAWALLLALQLLAEARNPRSPLQPYLRLLPAPPGSRLAAVFAEGTPATDLLLFSESELRELQCPPLAAAVLRERSRLQALHRLLFMPPGLQGEPLVSLESFIWAHCLVRSRALDLTARPSDPPPPAPARPSTDPSETLRPSHFPNPTSPSITHDPLPAVPDRQNVPEALASATGRSDSSSPLESSGRAASVEGSAFRVQCLLPVIDLCNHDGTGHACSLTVRDTPHGRQVELASPSEGVDPGQELCLDYGLRPMRDMLRGYGFVPSDAHALAPMEVYEDVGSSRQALVVLGSHKGSMFRLQEVRMLADSGSDPLLELQRASLCFVVADNAAFAAGGRDYGAAPQLCLDPCGMNENLKPREQGQQPGGGAGADSWPLGECWHVGMEAGWSGRGGADGGFGWAGWEEMPEGELRRSLGPDEERALSLLLVEECSEALRHWATSSQQDRALLEKLSNASCSQQYRDGPLGPDSEACPQGGSFETEPAEHDGSSVLGNGVESAAGEWRRRTHLHMAVQYRLERKLLLERVVEDLNAHATLLSCLEL